MQLYYQTALIGRRDLHLAPDPRSGAEMTLLRMLAFRPAAAGKTTAGGGKRATTAAKPVKQAAPAVQQAQPAREQPAPAATQATPARESTWQDPDWAALVPRLDLKGAVRMLAINCAYLRRDKDTLYFSADTNAESVLTPERRKALAEAVSAHFGEPLRVDIAFDAHREAPEAETPVQQESRETEERYAAARASLESDPNVQRMKTMFGAELKTDSIEPISPAQSD